MKVTTALAATLTLMSAAPCRAADSAAGEDPFAPYLDGKPPAVVRELPAPPEAAPPEGVTVRRVVFRARTVRTEAGPVDTEVYALVAGPSAPGRYPGLLVLHGGAGKAAEESAVAWARRGYVALAPDLPGIGEPSAMPNSSGWWKSLKYGEGRWRAQPDVTASVIFDAVLAGLKGFDLLRAHPGVDPARVGAVGISWGGYTTAMVSALAGDRVRAAFSVYGCGFYDLATPAGPKSLGGMSAPERARWLADLDPGRRAGSVKAPFFIAAATNDFFFFPPAVSATLSAIPGAKNHLFAPNANHAAPVPGGSVKPPPGVWLAMEIPFFEYHLKGVGDPLPLVRAEPGSNGEAGTVRFTVSGARSPVERAEVWFSAGEARAWTERKWVSVPAARDARGGYSAALPPEAAAGGGYWFALVSDARPVTVSGEMVRVPPAVR